VWNFEVKIVTLKILVSQAQFQRYDFSAARPAWLWQQEVQRSTGPYAPPARILGNQLGTKTEKRQFWKLNIKDI
jgi:hypothetical protein